jgi:hypothetical protein
LTDSKNSQRLLDEKPNGVKDLIDKIVYSMKKKKKDHGCVTS